MITGVVLLALAAAADCSWSGLPCGSVRQGVLQLASCWLLPGSPCQHGEPCSRGQAGLAQRSAAALPCAQAPPLPPGWSSSLQHYCSGGLGSGQRLCRALCSARRCCTSVPLGPGQASCPASSTLLARFLRELCQHPERQLGLLTGRQRLAHQRPGLYWRQRPPMPPHLQSDAVAAVPWRWEGDVLWDLDCRAVTLDEGHSGVEAADQQRRRQQGKEEEHSPRHGERSQRTTR